MPHADSSTTLGRLQRGRGAGWLEARDAHDPKLLLACLADDPRVQPGEQRAAYYADLAVALRVDAVEIAGDAPTPLRREVLTELAHRGDADASRLLGSFPPAPDAAPPTEPTPLEELLGVLGRIGDPRAIDDAFDVLTHDSTPGEQAAALRYLRSLEPSHTLGQARVWLLDDDPRFVAAAAALLATHSEPSDLSDLRGTMPRAWAHHWVDVIGDLVDAIGRHPEASAAPELTFVYHEIESSLVRARAVRAMSHDPSFAVLFAAECRHDCEPSTRSVAARFS